MAVDIPSIAILGGGPAGLALARILELNNISYIVYERDDSSEWVQSNGGSGTLDLHADSGQMALKAAGLFDQFKQLSRSEGSTVIAGPQGNTIANWGSIEEADRPEIDRRDLRVMLLESIPKSKVVWKKKVQKVHRNNEGSIVVEFEDGEAPTGFKLVVGADGAWSKARTVVTDAKPRYSGLHYIANTIQPGNPIYDRVQKLVGLGNHLVFGPFKSIAVMALARGNYHVLCGMHLPEDWDKSVLKDVSAFQKYLVEEVYSDWSESNTDFIKYSDGPYHDWPLLDLDPEVLNWKTVPGITLIGDAAHLTTPFLGEGVNCAMHDSYQLAQAILKHGLDNIDDAISEYEQDMFVRGQKLIRGSARNGQLLFNDPAAPRQFLMAMQEVIAETHKKN